MFGFLLIAQLFECYCFLKILILVSILYDLYTERLVSNTLRVFQQIAKRKYTITNIPGYAHFCLSESYYFFNF